MKLKSREKVEILRASTSPAGLKYAVTNLGRVISFSEILSDGHFLKPGRLSNYPCVSIFSKKEKKTVLIHRLVAKYFLTQPSPAHKFVIHLNYNKEDNNYKNLKWATRDQTSKHWRNNPTPAKIGNRKLSIENVKAIKKSLLSTKASLKKLSKKFGVSDMQIHRIKTGENWGHVIM
jgi:hypothetical protein